MRLFITGASGYVGQNLLHKIISGGDTPVCLIRPGSQKKLGEIKSRIEIIEGDVRDIAAWKDGLHDIDAFINLIGIIREFSSRGVSFEELHFQATVDLADLANELGVKRFLQMSALGASLNSSAKYHRTKARAEKYLQRGSLAWTIFRPSLIIGKGSEAIGMFADMARKSPVMPVIGDGSYQFQPVDIDDVTEGFAEALENDSSIGKIYDIGGPDRISLNRMLDLIAEKLGKKARKIKIPAGLLKLSVMPFDYFSFFPLTRGMIDMLTEGNTTDSNQYFQDFDINPTPFEESLQKALAD